MENNSSKRIHPLVAGAAVSVILVSLTGVAAITGLIPNSHGTAAPVATSVGATAPVALAESDNRKEAPAPAEKHSYAPRKEHTATQAATAQAPAVCHNCGRIESVQAIQHAAQPSGVGVVAGAVLGGVLGNQIGAGNGRKLATVAGAVGGGYAGNEIEKRTHSTTSYQVRVRMEDGDVRNFPYAERPGWNAGDRVRVVDGQLTSRA